MHVIRGCVGATYHDGWVYSLGGQNYTDKIMKKCERYNVEKDQWEFIASMNIKRKNCAVSGLSDYIYAFGGASLDDLLDSIE